MFILNFIYIYINHCAIDFSLQNNFLVNDQNFIQYKICGPRIYSADLPMRL